jgi:rhomboid protease GluP
VQVFTVIKENWLTRKPHEYLLNPTIGMAILLLSLCFSFLTDTFDAQSWMAATPHQVFTDHQYWRAWTTLFAHADLGHLLSNTLLFIPLTYLLTAYFGLWFFPLFGFFLGGIMNLIVLKTLPNEATLLGVSGVVYWMGAAWFTLFILIDKRKHLKARFANVLFLTLMLFVPETYSPQISYLSHFIGFILGILSALVFYYLKKDEFARAEVREIVIEDDEPLEPGTELSAESELTQQSKVEVI